MVAEPIDLESARKKRGGKSGDGGAKKPPAKVDEPGLHQDAVALRFAAECEDRVRFNWHTGEWHIWDGACWARNETGGAIELIRDLCRRIRDEARLKKVIERLGTVGFARGVETFARSDARLAVVAEDFDPDPWLLATPGGMVDLRTGELLPASPAAMCSRATAVTPDETSDLAVRWRAFLEEATGGDADVQLYLQKIAGYALTGVTSEQCLFFLYGPGGNGKSVFVNTLRRLMGSYATAAPMDVFTAPVGHGEQHPTALAMLCGARLVTAVETEEGRHWAEARIKTLTGGDPITARFMRENFFTFEPAFKLALVGNHKPSLKSVDQAIRRRFRMVPFDKRPADEDPALVEKLVEEWPAILRWAIEGVLEWQAEGLHPPEAVRETTAAYLAEQDLVGRWIESQCEVAPQPFSALDEGVPRITMAALYENFKLWCEPQGERPCSMKALGMDLEKRGYPAYRTAQARWRAGIRLKSDAMRWGGNAAGGQDY